MMNFFYCNISKPHSYIRRKRSLRSTCGFCPMAQINPSFKQLFYCIYTLPIFFLSFVTTKMPVKID